MTSEGHLPNGVVKVDVIHRSRDTGTASVPLRWLRIRKPNVSRLPMSHRPLNTSPSFRGFSAIFLFPLLLPCLSPLSLVEPFS